MKKINFNILLITCIACLAPIFVGIIYYNQLPDIVAIHFDINNNPDNFMSKEVVVFGIPSIMALIQIIMCITSDIRDKNSEANKKAMTIFKWIIPLITVVVYMVTIMFALNIPVDIRKVVMILLGVMFVVMGNYTPKMVGTVHMNWPKSKDERINNKVKRISGYMFIVDGLLSIMSVLFNPIVSVSVILLLILEAIALLIYVFVEEKR